MALGTVFYIQLATAAAYLVFALLFAFRAERSWLSGFFGLAALLTAAWSLAIAFENAGAPPLVTRMLGSLMAGGWYAVLLTLMRPAPQALATWWRLAIAAYVVLAVDLLFGLFDFQTFIAGVAIDDSVTRMATSIAGLVLVENLLRNASDEELWSVKQLGLGLATVYAYGLTVRIPQFITHDPESLLIAARPAIFLLVLPLFAVTAIRSTQSSLRIHSSRTVIFHTATLVGAGVLLQGVALVALYVRNFGGTTATILALLLGFGGTVAVASAVFSRSVRSRIRNFINENFFSYKYDYRLEWSKFIRSSSAWEEKDVPYRVLRTLTDLLDSPGGALWVLREGSDRFMPLATFCFGAEVAPIGAGDDAFQVFADNQAAFIELSAAKHPAAAYWQKQVSAGWLLVPMRFRNALVAVALLHRPRAARKLDWEDNNLVGLVSTQLAAYLVQEETARALADSRLLEEFNNRIAFSLHDIKNIMGQLELLAKNAQKFGHQEKFREDMVATIQNSVAKLHLLFGRLRGDTATQPAEARRLDISNFLQEFADRTSKLGVALALNGANGPVFADVRDADAFSNVLQHVVTNAAEANSENVPVRLGVEEQNGKIRITVQDAGSGMSARFIADELFRPLRTTKAKGLGIGAHQARVTMRNLGGDIEVHSKVGHGTTVLLTLPSAKEYGTA